MKKIIPYIFILAILIGFFSPMISPVAQVNAADILGTCTNIPPVAGVEQPDKNNITYAACYALTPGVNPVPWVPNTAQNVGVCTVNGVPETVHINLDACAKLNPGVNPVPWVQDATQTGANSISNVGSGSPDDFKCSTLGWSIMGCLANLTFGLFRISSFFAELAAKFLDFFIYYSTDSASYTNQFVEKGWGAVRDVANLIFIIALMYVAVKTVLSLHGSDSKKLIVNIIIFALIINFSLFATKVIIDASNILTRVFYNAITPVDSNGQSLGPEAGGQKSISLGIVQKYNPQLILTPGTSLNEPGKFIAVTLLLVAVTFYTMYIFFTVALLFVARVVSLWLSMIFAPFAFASYTVPLNMDSFGHEKWWDRLLHSAFLAPLFVFLLYLIVLFTGFLPKIISYPESADTMQKVMSVLVPFAIIVILLKKAKEKAEEYAQEMGEGVKKLAGLVAGVAAGATIGVTAKTLQGTAGRVGKRLFESESLKKWQDGGSGFARGIRRLGGGDDGKGGMAGASYDLRQGIGSGALKLASGVTGLNLGANSKFLTSEAGGYEADVQRRNAKRLKRVQGLSKVAYNEKAQQDLNKAQIDYHKLQSEHSGDLEKLKAAETAKRQELKDARSRFSADSPEVQNAGKALQDVIDDKKAIKQGGYDGEKYRTSNGKISKKMWEKAQEEEQNAKSALQEAKKEKAEADASLSVANAEKTVAEDLAKTANAALLAAQNAASANPGDTALAQTLVTAANTAKTAETKVEKANESLQAILAKGPALEAAEKRMKNAALVKDRVDRDKEAAGGELGYGYSMDDFEDERLPDLKNEVHHKEEESKKLLTENLENEWVVPWRIAEKRRSVEQIRMGAKPEKHGGDKGHGGGHFASEVFAGILAEEIAGDKGGGKSATAAAKGGGHS